MNAGWGADVVQLLIPHRPPFLWLDALASVDLDRTPPSLVAHRFLSASEPVFAGHFPGRPVFPGVLQLEAMAQAAGALSTLLELVEADPGGLDELANVDRVGRLDPRADPVRADAFRSRFAARVRPLSLGGAVSAKWVEPVFPGCRLDLFVELAHRVGHTWQFRGEVRVGAAVVTRGTLSGARVPG